MRQWFAHVPRVEALAGLLSLSVGVALMGLKFVAYFLTGSAAIFSDAMESIVNVAASGVAFYSLVVAHRPADPEHPYGHGKVEFLSASFEGGMILLAAIVIAVKTLDTLVFHSVEVAKVDIGLILVAIAMAANGAMGGLLVGLGRKRGSMTLEADGHHLLSDAVTSIAALGALAFVRLVPWEGARYADPAVAMLMAVYIAFTGIRLLRRSTAGLMDEQDQADVKLLAQLLEAHVGPEGKEPRICSYHKLRHRHSGRYHWVDFHIMIPPHISIQEGHAIASDIEYEIELALGEGNATAHLEPCPSPQCAMHPGSQARRSGVSE